ncbi:hypothetical protein, unknown function, partial [Leishmania donovani]
MSGWLTAIISLKSTGLLHPARVEKRTGISRKRSLISRSAGTAWPSPSELPRLLL